MTVFHLIYYALKNDLPITKEKGLKLHSRSEEGFTRFFEKEGIAKRKGVVMAVENSYPKHAIAGLYHPNDIVVLER